MTLAIRRKPKLEFCSRFRWQLIGLHAFYERILLDTQLGRKDLCRDPSSPKTLLRQCSGEQFSLKIVLAHFIVLTRAITYGDLVLLSKYALRTFSLN